MDSGIEIARLPSHVRFAGRFTLIDIWIVCTVVPDQAARTEGSGVPL